MMHDNSWGFNMGWGMWLVPAIIILIVAVVFFTFQKRGKK
jgi:cbb3-type cytochrome oxidase subunit 3